MATDFLSLPIVDLSPLSDKNISPHALAKLSAELDSVFRTTGFAYLTHAPLSFSHHDVFGLAREFFSLPEANKMDVAKRMFLNFDPGHENTYRGYFPPQSGSPDNLKEGFEIGPGRHDEVDLRKLGTDEPYLVKGATLPSIRVPKIQLNEANIWPSHEVYPYDSRDKLEQLHRELQDLSKKLLGLLAVAMGESEHVFEEEGWMDRSISTLRLLHYPPQPQPQPQHQPQSPTTGRNTNDAEAKAPKLCCTPHTDSGILTLLHQDATGGLEVQNARGAWVAAPYLPGSIVVNIGDLMARVSGGRYVATMHRVRAGGPGDGALGRFSVPFFFEPGEECLIRSVVDGDCEKGVRYGEHVKAKMSTWVEFQDTADPGWQDGSA